MRPTRCDQPPMQIVRLGWPIANLLSSWCDSTIDYIHYIEPLNEWLGMGRCKLCLLMQLVAHSGRLLDRRLNSVMLGTIASDPTALIVQVSQRGNLLRVLRRPL